VTASVVPIAAGPSLDAAVEEFLARPRLDRGTARSYAQALTRLARDLDAGGPLGQVSPEQVADAFTAAWDGVAPRTWNRHLAAVRSFRSWAAGRWPVVDLAAHLERRKENPDRTKVIDRHRIEALWERRDIPLREKTLWRLLYESAARAQEAVAALLADHDPGRRRRPPPP
jgi:site-specific recombinase XerD